MKRFLLLIVVAPIVTRCAFVEASTVGVDSIESMDDELVSFVAGGTSYSREDLLPPTLSRFTGFYARTIAVPPDQNVPAAGMRSTLLTSDFRLDTGIINVGVGPGSASLDFSPRLVNGPGPDLVMFESSSLNDFVVRANGVEVAYLNDSYGPELLNVTLEAFARIAGPPGSISELENDDYVFEDTFVDVGIAGIAIDLDDFAVEPLGSVGTVEFGSAEASGPMDPFLFMGINSAKSSVLLDGDYNNNGQVEQADLDLVLLHWGADASTVPDAWTNDLPTGTIDQNELDGVLLNWGNTSAAIGAASVPEPNSVVVVLLAVGAVFLQHARRQFLKNSKRDWSICPTLFLVFTGFATSTLHAAEFIPFPFESNGVSEDGSVVALEQFITTERGVTYRWTDETGPVSLGHLPGHTHARFRYDRPAVSGDGSTVVGLNGLSTTQAFVHNEAVGMRAIEGWHASAVSYDGSVVVGEASFSGENHAFRWTESEGVISLGTLLGTSESDATDISADGSVVVGYASDSGDPWPFPVFRWTAETGITSLGILGRSNVGEPKISADGAVIGGAGLISSTTDYEAFLYTEDTGVQGLGWLPGTEDDDGTNLSSVTGITGIGTAVGGSGKSRDRRRGFVWSEASGMLDFQQVLTNEHGLGEAFEGWTLRYPFDISADGRIITGNGFDPSGENTGWLVRLDRPILSSALGLDGDYNNNGQVEQADLDLVLLHWGADAASVPDTWMNDLPTGTIDQNELDGVLLNWGNANAAIGAASVPEPSTVALLLTTLFAFSLLRRK